MVEIISSFLNYILLEIEIEEQIKNLTLFYFCIQTKNISIFYATASRTSWNIDISKKKSTSQ